MLELGDGGAERLAEAMRSRREEFGLSQRAASNIAKLGESTWRYIESASRDHIYDSSVKGICRALRWTEADLLAAAGVVDSDVSPVLRWDGPGGSWTCRVEEPDDQVIERIRRALENTADWRVVWVNPPSGSGQVVLRELPGDPKRARLLDAVRTLPSHAVGDVAGYVDRVLDVERAELGRRP